MAGGKNNEPIIVAQIMGKMNGGGVETVIMNYYRHIDRTKVQFDFICDEDSTNIPYEEIEKLGGHVILCPPYQKLFKYMKFLKKLFHEKNYYVVHSNINTLSIFPLKEAKKAGVKVRIAHSHNMSDPHEFKRNLLKNILRKFSKKYATDYYACGEAAGRYQFGNKVFDAGKVTIVRNAIDVEKYKYNPAIRKKIRDELGIEEKDFVVGHIGAFRRQKNHIFLIDVFARVKKIHKNAKLVLAGQGPLEETIRHKVKEMGLDRDVLFLGQCNNTNELYSAFDVFCLPSLYEGLPVVAIEAQANGLRCIFSKSITTEIRTEKSTFITNDISEFANAIINEGANCERINNLKKDYDITYQSMRLLDNYHEALKRKTKTSPFKEIIKKIRLSINKIGSKHRAKLLNGINPTIISNNCFAGIIYQYLGLKYTSPTIGLYFFAKDYIKFVKNFDYYISKELKFIPYWESSHRDALIKKGETYCPIGVLGDVEIIFLHYKTESEALEKWNKRVSRINKDCLIFKFSEQNECTEKDIHEFANIDIPNKLFITARKYDGVNSIVVSGSTTTNEVMKDYYSIHKYVDIVKTIKDSNNKKKKIAFVVYGGAYSGAETVNVRIANALKDEYDFVYISKHGSIDHVLRENNIRHLPIRKYSKKELANIISREEPDIIHATDYRASIISALAAKKTPVISHIHNNAPWIRKKSARTLAYLYAAKRAAKVLFVSNSIKDEFVYAKKISRNTIIVSNPVSVQDIMRKKDGTRNGKKYDICCVARVTDVKNPELFIDVISEIKKKIPTIKAVWVGGGDMLDKAKKICSERDLKDNIIFTGHVDNPVSYYSESKVFLMTSRWEGYGLSAFEALAMGLPCVVAKVGGLEEIVNDACGRLCVSKDDYVSESVRLMSDDSYYKKKSHEAINRAKRLDNHETYFRDIDNIYKSIATWR